MEVPEEGRNIKSSKYSQESTWRRFLNMCQRWLSMERCVARTLSQWPALQAYFNSSDDKEKPGHVKRCADAYVSEEMKLMYYFLQYALTKLNKFNILFQSHDCRVLELEKETEGLLKAYVLNFMKVDAVNIDDLSKVDYKCEEQQKSDDLTIGIQASRYLESISEDCDPAIITCFYRSVRAAYVAAVEKFLNKFPFGNPILKSVRILNPLHRTDVTEREGKERTSGPLTARKRRLSVWIHSFCCAHQ
ncbi:uncharacterized protein LOC132870730 isoform X2 [Neoarius graeffei]|uniref:uncharacterized protein LOC132870730 isoform X2 n=1 Tax=Neoarius graeffei TaxID=443677 RepID=UPI00298C75FD|nr:uncharacterized protein LOC132870730 isoform X2 [Neoarius graeffei]